MNRPQTVMREIDRSLIVLHPKQPFADCVNSSLPDPAQVSLEEICADLPTFLVPVFESDEEGMDYVRLHALELFEHMLAEWCCDSDFWPIKLDYNMFCT